jgi:integrase
LVGGRDHTDLETDPRTHATLPALPVAVARQRITARMRMPVANPARTDGARPIRVFWHDLGRLLIDLEAKPHHYLRARQKAIPHKGKSVIHRFPEKPMGEHGAHDWWYQCPEHAGIVPKGTTSGEKMHQARYTAGQRVLDKTGNLIAVQRLLGHPSIETTAESYVDWDLEQLARRCVR